MKGKQNRHIFQSEAENIIKEAILDALVKNAAACDESKTVNDIFEKIFLNPLVGWALVEYVMAMPKYREINTKS